MIPVILSGGSGSRLWPLSRAQHPKQFLDIGDQRSLFQKTLARLQKMASQSLPPLIVCQEEHRFLVAEQCREIGAKPKAILLEPIGRNTAPAIAAAVRRIMVETGDDLILVLPADHHIKDLAAFDKAVRFAKQEALRGEIVTFGILPTKAETGYGYMEVEKASTKPQRVKKFVEKPDADTAQQYLESGKYYWNSGMFLFKASTMLKALELYAPEVLAASDRALQAAKDDLDFTRLGKNEFISSPDISIDYAVMEVSHNVTMVPLDAGWSDVGVWSSVWEMEEKDQNGNAVHGDALLYDTKNTYVHASHRLVTVLGMENVVVVETSDAVMVTTRDRCQDVKKLVEKIKQQNRLEATNHRQVYRPWGNYDSIDRGERYQVKRITVNPGQKLSVQMHHHRAEHWIVVQGTAMTTIGTEQHLVSENQSIYIPIGVVHALENPGKIPLEMIEVQSGSYLGEDDIIRFEDKYGRVDALPA